MKSLKIAPTTTPITSEINFINRVCLKTQSDIGFLLINLFNTTCTTFADFGI